MIIMRGCARTENIVYSLPEGRRSGQTSREKGGFGKHSTGLTSSENGYASWGEREKQKEETQVGQAELAGNDTM